MRPMDIELYTMIEKGDADRVGALLKRGADPNGIHTNGYSVLMLTVRHWKLSPETRFEISKILIENGADPAYISKDGYQALTLAQDIDVVSYLLNAGVEVTPEIATNILYSFHGDPKMKSLFEQRGIQTGWVDSARQIYYRIQEYSGRSLYTEVLKEALPVIQNSFLKLQQYRRYDIHATQYIGGR